MINFLLVVWKQPMYLLKHKIISEVFSFMNIVIGQLFIPETRIGGAKVDRWLFTFSNGHVQGVMMCFLQAWEPVLT